jgi:hypothetical protein
MVLPYSVNNNYFPQCFGSGSILFPILIPDSIRSVDPDPYSESGSRRAKMTQKSRKKLRNSMFWNAEGFYCNLEVLYGGPGIVSVNSCFWYKKMNFFSAVNLFQFLVIKTLDPYWIWIGIQPRMLDPDQMITDPKHWFSCLKKASFFSRMCF